MQNNILRHFKFKSKVTTNERFPLVIMAKGKESKKGGKGKRDKNVSSPKATSPTPGLSNSPSPTPTPTPTPPLLPISETPSRPGASNIRAAAPLWDSVNFEGASDSDSGAEADITNESKNDKNIQPQQLRPLLASLTPLNQWMLLLVNQKM